MLFCPYQNYHRNANKISYMRLFHASPKTPAVDIYADNRLIAQNLSYKSFTKYLSLAAKSYNITVFRAGTKTKALLSKNITVPSGVIFTTAAIGVLPNIDLLSIAEPVGPFIPHKTFVRFSNLSPNSPSLDITYANGKPLFKNIAYKNITDYATLIPGKYNLTVRETNTNKTVLISPNITFKSNRFYTIYSIGLLNENPPLQLLIPLDGNSYLKL